MHDQAETVNILGAMAKLQSAQEYQELNWEGSFEEHVEHKKKITRYRFFRDYAHNGRDAVYGIDQSLTHLVDIFKSASRNYGTERRVILLHGPVGSAKSTIVRLLKKGLEEYSRARRRHVHVRMDQHRERRRKGSVRPGQ